MPNTCKVSQMSSLAKAGCKKTQNILSLFLKLQIFSFDPKFCVSAAFDKPRYNLPSTKVFVQLVLNLRVATCT